ncbi:hypothetical protein [Pontibacter harenae]|uniref:hypothetical protein n=1 Tax=Pontibacter harenae TaxID=2894083 RepID=UPI001E368410|nr:hypothetical protein [Pontibacter harenae]MCC9167229.1 hypothetical protein [Pontibacter harenae]
MSKQVQYEGVKPEAFNQFKSKLQQMGVNLPGNAGSFSEKGVSGKYAYDETTELLKIDDLSVGFPASMMLNSDTLVKRMTDLIQQHGGRPKV